MRIDREACNQVTQDIVAWAEPNQDGSCEMPTSAMTLLVSSGFDLDGASALRL